MKGLKIVLISMLILANFKMKAQFLDSLKIDKTIIPVVFLDPETSWAFGASGIFSLKKKSAPKEERPSQVFVGLIYTLKNQLLLFSQFEIYQKNRTIRHRGEIGYYKYFYNFYGIGSESREADLEFYDLTFPRIEYTFSKRVSNNINIGAGYFTDNFKIPEVDEDGLLNQLRPIGWQGGFKSNFIGIFFIDTRDNLNATQEGYYFETLFEKSVGFLGSDYDYYGVLLDARYFHEIKEDWILGHHLWFKSSSKGTPFYLLSHIATSKIARGFGSRRYVNYHAASLQSELRFPIYKRLRGAAFYTLSILPDELDKPFADSEKLTYGFGLRYVVDVKNRTSLRVDVARGDGKLNFYFTANEAF